MNVDIHCRIAAALSILAGALELLFLAAAAAVLGSLAAFVNIDRNVMGIFATFGAVAMRIFGTLAAMEIVAAVFSLRGSKLAKAFLLVFNALFLLKFPVGTAIGAYSLWALLRKIPGSQEMGAATTSQA